MCTGASIALAVAAVAASAGGSAIAAENARKQRSRQDSDIARGIEGQEEQQRLADQLFQQNINEFDPARRDEERDVLAEDTTDRLRELILPGADVSQVTERVSGNVSPLALDRSSRSSAGEADRLQKLTSLLGRIEGPTQLRRNESYRFADYQSQLAELLNQQSAGANIAQLSANSRGLSPGGQLASGLLGAAGQVAGFGAGFAGGSATKSPGVQIPATATTPARVRLPLAIPNLR